MPRRARRWIQRRARVHLQVMIATAEFELRVAPHRRELLAHCYRMLGSAHDAEDQVQETLVRAWRAFDRYDPSRRLAAHLAVPHRHEHLPHGARRPRSRRPLPSGLGPAFDDPLSPMLRADDVPWLQPLPDRARAGRRRRSGRAARCRRSTLRLAFVAALQLLPARQRAMLVLHEVLDWSAAEVAEALGTTPTAVHSGLQRARARLAAAGVDTDGDRRPRSRRPGVPGARRPLRPGLRGRRRRRARPPAHRRRRAGDAAGAQLVRRARRLRGVHRLGVRHPWHGLADVADRGQRPAGARRLLRGPATAAIAARHVQLHSVQLLTVTADGIAANITFVDPEALAPFDLPANVSGCGTCRSKIRAALSPRILARESSDRSPIIRSMASDECGHEPSWCG